MLFLWFKALHIIAVICWFAGLFYLPRLFVYHAAAEDDISHERFCIMERRLYRGIMTPAMIATVILGLAALTINYQYYLSQGWMHTKLALVALLVIYHFVCGAYVKRFTQRKNQHTHVFYRWFNEAPTLLLVGAVLLVVLRPF